MKLFTSLHFSNSISNSKFHKQLIPFIDGFKPLHGCIVPLTSRGKAFYHVFRRRTVSTYLWELHEFSVIKLIFIFYISPKDPLTFLYKCVWLKDNAIKYFVVIKQYLLPNLFFTWFYSLIIHDTPSALLTNFSTF